MDKDKDEKTLIHLKLDKSKSKTRFTKTKNNLLALLNNELINKPAIEETGVKLDNALDHVMESLERLNDYFSDQEKRKHFKRIFIINFHEMRIIKHGNIK